MQTDINLLASLKTVLAARDFDTFSDEYLMFEINQAIATINRCRRFKPTEDKAYDPKYEYLIVPMCVSSLSKIGAEGQTSHSENGVTRYYDAGGEYPKALLQQIIPLIK